MNHHTSFSRKPVPSLPKAPQVRKGREGVNSTILIVFIICVFFLWGSWSYNDSPIQFLKRCSHAMLSTADQTPVEMLNHGERVVEKLTGSDAKPTHSQESIEINSNHSDVHPDYLRHADQSTPQSVAVSVDFKAQSASVQKIQSQFNVSESVIPVEPDPPTQNKKSDTLNAHSSVFGERLDLPSDTASPSPPSVHR